MLTEFINSLIAKDKTGEIEPTYRPVLAPSNMEFHDMERHSPSRFRERYRMDTSSIAAFVDYTNKRSKEVAGSEPEHTITSVDPDTCAAAAIFNSQDIDGEPGHCDDKAVCKLKALPMYAALIELDGRGRVASLSQRDMIDWIRDFNEHINEPQKLVEAFSKLNVERVGRRSQEEGDYRAEQTEMERIQVKSDDAEVPDTIKITMRPYEGFSERTVEIGVSAATDRNDKRVELRLRIRGFATLQLMIAEEFADMLNEKLSVKPIVGTIHPS